MNQYQWEQNGITVVLKLELVDAFLFLANCQSRRAYFWLFSIAHAPFLSVGVELIECDVVGAVETDWCCLFERAKLLDARFRNLL